MLKELLERTSGLGLSKPLGREKLPTARLEPRIDWKPSFEDVDELFEMS